MPYPGLLALPCMLPSDHPLPPPPPLHQPAQPLMLSCLACACPSRDSRPASAPCMPGPPPLPAHFPWRWRESVAAVYLRAHGPRAQGTGRQGRGGERNPLHCENEAHSLLSAAQPPRSRASGAPSGGRRRQAGLWASSLGSPVQSPPPEPHPARLPHGAPSACLLCPPLQGPHCSEHSPEGTQKSSSRWVTPAPAPAPDQSPLCPAQQGCCAVRALGKGPWAL